MVTDHAATALDNFRFDLPEVRGASVHPSRHHVRVLGLIFEPRRHDKNTKSTLPAGVPNEWN
jgi:hypothetical protein